MDSNKVAKMYVEEHAVRLIAFQVLLVTLLTLYIKNYWLSIGLTIDFSIRAFTYLPAPLALPVKVVRRFIRWDDRNVFAPPKKFSAMLGAAFSAIIALLLYTQFFNAAYLVGGVVIICATLESLFKVCVGCYVYDWFISPLKD